jgi:hypothetical protein
MVAEDHNLPKMLDRLGNLCLLAGANPRAANKPWGEKVEMYKRSRLRVTKLLTTGQYQTWGTATIERRQAYMAELAEAEWRWP